MRLLIIDDHRLVRLGFRKLISELRGIEIIGEADDAASGLDQIILKHPDVAMLDINLPDRSGLDVLIDIRSAAPQTQVLIVSMYDDPGRVRTALERGAAGYLLKNASLAELEIALRAAERGQTFLSPALSTHLLSPMRRSGQARTLDGLSARQREVLHALGRGLPNRDIAEKLGISVRTVETHRARLMEALGCRRASELIRLAVQIDAGVGE